MVVDIGISHFQAPGLFVFLEDFQWFLFLCKVKRVQPSFCTTQLLVSYIAVSISCECYKAKAAQTVGTRGPMTLHACTQTE